MSENIDYFDGIRRHFDTLDTQVIEVPEWGLVGDKAIYSNLLICLKNKRYLKVRQN